MMPVRFVADPAVQVDLKFKACIQKYEDKVEALRKALDAIIKEVTEIEIQACRYRLQATELNDVGSVHQARRSVVYYSKQTERFIDGIDKKYKLISRWYSFVKVLKFLILDALNSCNCLTGVKIYCLPQNTRFSVTVVNQRVGTQSQFEFLEDNSVLGVVSIKNIIESSSLSNSTFSSSNAQRKFNDELFEKELKGYFCKSEPLEKSCKKYFKNFFCEYTLSPKLRRWLWRERIGNPIRMNRTIFNSWTSKANLLGICADQAAVIKADLIRACSCIDEKYRLKVYADLERLITVFVV